MMTLALLVTLGQSPSPQLMTLLQHLESPPTRQQLLEVGGSQVESALNAVVTDSRRSVRLRGAALAAVAQFDSPSTRALVTQFSLEGPAPLRLAALETIGRTLTADAALTRVAVTALQADDEVVVRGAIRALGRVSRQTPARPESLEALTALRARADLSAETRAQLERALKR
ncbi:MAG: hypothetical protein MUC96_06570 [Myxococcaceae bacterium]|jgi:hypothetical protein|nr:hypothetical protein [Myxococcaceae bacterium]